MPSCHTHGHAIPLVRLKSLSVDASSSSHFVRRRACRTSCVATARTCVHHLPLTFWRQFDKYSSSCLSVEVRPSHVNHSHDFSSTFYPWRSPTARLSAPPVAESTRATLASRASFFPSRPTSRAGWASWADPCRSPPILSWWAPSPSHVGTSLSGLSCPSCGDECTPPPHVMPWRTTPSEATCQQAEQFLLIVLHGFPIVSCTWLVHVFLSLS